MLRAVDMSRLVAFSRRIVLLLVLAIVVVQGAAGTNAQAPGSSAAAAAGAANNSISKAFAQWRAKALASTSVKTRMRSAGAPSSLRYQKP